MYTVNGGTCKRRRHKINVFAYVRFLHALLSIEIRELDPNDIDRKYVQSREQQKISLSQGVNVNTEEVFLESKISKNFDPDG